MKIRPENLLFPLPGTCEIRNSAVQWKKQFCRKGRAAGHLEPGRRVFFGRAAGGLLGTAQRRYGDRSGSPRVLREPGSPFLAFRTVTDTRDHDGTGSFEKNCARASRLSAEFVRQMLRLI